jgi:hypothetical protein
MGTDSISVPWWWTRPRLPFSESNLNFWCSDFLILGYSGLKITKDQVQEIPVIEKKKKPGPGPDV